MYNCFLFCNFFLFIKLHFCRLFHSIFLANFPFFNSKEFKNWKVGFDIGEMSVCLYPPSKTSSNRPIFKIIFLLERYDIRYLYFVLFVCPSVRTDGQKDKFVKCRSNSPIFKFLFLLARFSIRYLSFVLLSVHPFVQTDGRIERQNRQMPFFSPILKTLFLLERYLTRYLYLINCFRLSVRFSVCLCDFLSVCL